MSDKNSIVGTRIGLYDVLYECDFKSNDGHRMFHVKCSECGLESDVQIRNIRNTKKCKHKNRFQNFINSNKHWENKKLQRIFSNMLNRCYSKKDKNYRWYGEKGIKICDEWTNDYFAFEQWALSHGYKEDLTIDRKDSNKDYCPENCRWISRVNNSKYKSSTVLTEVDGIFHTGREWSLILNLGKNTINRMLRQYPEELVKEFIRCRLKDKTLIIKPGQTWLSVYKLDF